MIRKKFPWKVENDPPPEWFDFDRREKMIVVVWARNRQSGRDSTASFPVDRITMKAAIKLARQFFARSRWKLTFVQIAGQVDDRWINEYLPLKKPSPRPSVPLPPTLPE